MNHKQRLFYWATTIILLLFSFTIGSPSARSEYLGGFYSWVKLTVVGTVMDAETETLLIVVRDGWSKNEVPMAYRDWLGGYVVCTQSQSHFANRVGIKFKVGRLNRESTYGASGWMPRDRCGIFLENVAKGVEYRQKSQ